MGEKEGEKKAADKKDDGAVTTVFKMDLHCEGCAKKVKKAVRSFDGVEEVKADCTENKVTVKGKVDPGAIKERLEQKTKKKVELVSPQPKKDGGGDKKPEEKAKDDKKKEEVKKPKETTALLKIRLHCDGCIHKIRKIISKFDGVEKVDIDKAKDVVTVNGSMDPKQLVPYLSQKLRRSVEIVPPPPKKDEGGDQKPKEGGEKKEASGGGDKKENEAGGGGGGDKKDKEAGGGDGGKKEEGGGAKVEVSKMEYHGYPYPQAPMYWHDGQAYAQNYPMEVHHQGYVSEGNVDQGYVNQGYMVPANHPVYAPQMFSDENPNACSVM